MRIPLVAPFWMKFCVICTLASPPASTTCEPIEPLIVLPEITAPFVSARNTALPSLVITLFVMVMFVCEAGELEAKLTAVSWLFRKVLESMTTLARAPPALNWSV